MKAYGGDERFLRILAEKIKSGGAKIMPEKFLFLELMVDPKTEYPRLRSSSAAA